MMKPSYLKLRSGEKIAYQLSEGSGPGIIFLGGFRSDMTGSKAEALAGFCAQRGIAFVRFDYLGHGQSTGTFEDFTLSDWKDNALSVFTRLTQGPQILIGSSMGGWLALLLAIEKPRRIAGIIGIAAAPDFTEHMFHEKMTQQQQQDLIIKGKIMVPSDMGEPYPVTKRLIEEGRKHALLHRQIPVYCPVRLMHGIKDEDVPWEVSLALNEKIASQDVKTILIEGGDHRLSQPSDIEKLLSVTVRMLEHIKTNRRIKEDAE